MFCDLLHIGKSFLTPSLLPFEFRKCVRTFVNQISRIREIREGSTSKFVFTGTNNSFAFLFWQLFSSKYRYHGELMTQKRHLKVLLLTLKLIRQVAYETASSHHLFCPVKVCERHSFVLDQVSGHSSGIDFVAMPSFSGLEFFFILL